MNLFSGLWLVIAGAQCANILMVYETARRSHQIWIESLAQALIQEGHNITMGGCFSKLSGQSDKYHPIRFEGTFFKHMKFNKSRHLESTPIQKLSLNYKYSYAICKTAYRSEGFGTLWNYPKNFTFDIIVMDLTFGACLYPLIQKFGNPYTIGFTPSALTPYLSSIFGNGVYPSHVISPLLGQDQETSFLNRVYNYAFTRMEIVFKQIWERRALENLAESLLNETFSFRDLEKSISLLFVNEDPLLIDAKPFTPNIIPVGGMHLKSANAMTGIFHAIVDTAKQGVVFYSLGTDVQPNIFKKTEEAFVNAFMKLQQIVFIWNKKLTAKDYKYLTKTSNLFIEKWLLQNDLLGHPNTGLLITTGGTLSIQEAILNGVPVVGIPIYDEHHRNIKFITDNKLGLKLDYNNLTEDTIFEAINAIVQDPVYTQNMEKFAKKFNDQAQNPLQKAVYWVEYILRHNSTNGADFLTPKSRHLSFFISHSVDVEIFLISLILTIVLLAFMLLKIIFKICINLRKASIVSKQKNKRKIQ